jgi:predicted ATP-grasp superfamily ATP-dependent carboligase
MAPEPCLIVATSARALVCAAHRARLSALAVDAFADADTRALARRCLRVPLASSGGLAAQALARLLERLPPLRLIYGSGFEAQPALLARAAARHRLAGNEPEVLALAADPRRFFALLDALGIAHPEVAFEPPPAPQDWLAKRAGGAGGGHVRSAAGAPAGGHLYFQRYVAGPAYSFLFLADGARVRPIGFNRLLPAPRAAPGRWAWAGAVQARPPPRAQAAALAAAQALTTRLGLRGLNGLDFIAPAAAFRLVELNARPTATLELWDRPPAPALLDAHLAACAGRLPPPWPAPVGVRALAVVYAERTLRIPEGFRWPRAARDRPMPGARVRARCPLCTVHAAARTASEAEARLNAARRRLLAALGVQRQAPRPRSAGWAHGEACA